MKYIKEFASHSDYTTYINGQNAILPNVSNCEHSRIVHYNLFVERRLTAIVNIEGMKLYFDDFPEEVCENEFDGDMEAFIDYALNAPENTNEYQYTGETFEYDNVEYYLWENSDGEYDGTYILTDTLDFTGLSLEDDYDNHNCPYVYLLIGDMEVYREAEDSDDWLITVSSADNTNIMNSSSASLFSEIEVDMVKLPNVPTEYNEIGEHVIKYTLVSPTTIGQNAFKDCTTITDITIPNNITSIGNYAFSGCSNLTSVTVLATTPPTLGNNVFANNASGRKIYVPSASVNTYKAASGWSSYASDIEALS